MYIVSRTSKWAIWSRRFASFALPLSVLPVWMHRNQFLASEAFQIVFGLALLLATLAVLTGISAYFRLWHTGDHGWGRSTFGIFLGLLCLSPVIYGVTLGMHYPLINDVSTDLVRPLELLVKTSAPIDSGVTPEEISRAFPDAISRSYALTPKKMFEMVEKLVGAREWDIRVRREPGIGGREGQINAMAMTLMGWRDEVVIRASQTSAGTKIDMRSTSLNGVGDLGANGKRIESFLSNLDALVALTLEQPEQ